MQRGGGGAAAGGASKQELTFPIIPFKDIVDLFHNAFSMSYTLAEISNPQPAVAAKIYSTLLDLITGMGRDEVNRIVASALETLENPELYRDALAQLALFREMEALCKASRFDDFHIEDLTAPTGARFQRIISAILNFGRFKEDVMRQHAEMTDSVGAKERELLELHLVEQDWKQKIAQLREQMALEEPERENLLRQKSDQEAVVRDLHGEIALLEQRVQEDRKQLGEVQQRTASVQFDVRKLEQEILDIRSQLVSSPERLQDEHARRKARLEHARRELGMLQEDKKKRMGESKALQDITLQLNRTLGLVVKVEEQQQHAHDAEEATKSQKDRIDTHQFKMKELGQTEREAQRELSMAEEKHARLQAQKAQKVQALAGELKLLQREREARTKTAHVNEAKAQALRAEAQALRQQLDKERQRHEDSHLRVNNLLGELFLSFERFTDQVGDGVTALSEATKA